MDQEQLLKKLLQIEEQARLTLEEFPRHLTKERLRLIMALAAQMRSELTFSSLAEGGVCASNDDDQTVPRARPQQS